MKKPLSKEALIEMLPLIGWEYHLSAGGRNDKLISVSGKFVKVRVLKDRFEFNDLHSNVKDYFNISYRMEFNEHEIEYDKEGKFISIFPKGLKNPGTFLLLNGDK